MQDFGTLQMKCPKDHICHVNNRDERWGELAHTLVRSLASESNLHPCNENVSRCNTDEFDAINIPRVIVGSLPNLGLHLTDIQDHIFGL
jgi:hypothetical protein